jgi:hypothetical protein
LTLGGQEAFHRKMVAVLNRCESMTSVGYYANGLDIKTWLFFTFKGAIESESRLWTKRWLVLVQNDPLVENPRAGGSILPLGTIFTCITL